MEFVEFLLSSINRIAYKLNQNTLTEDNYVAAGGKYNPENFDEYFGNFSSVLELCGIKIRKNR